MMRTFRFFAFLSKLQNPFGMLVFMSLAGNFSRCLCSLRIQHSLVHSKPGLNAQNRHSGYILRKMVSANTCCFYGLS